MTDYGAVDIWCNPFTEAGMAQFAGSEVQEAAELFGQPDLFTGAVRTPDEFVEKLDRLGIDTVLIPALKYGNTRHRGLEVDIPYELVHDICREYPDRFKGLAGINPHDGMEGVREMVRAVEEYGFVGANIDVYGFNVPLNHRKFYPFYTKCAELDVPVVMQTGHSAIRTPNKHGKPIHLDDIAIDFPELDLVGSHTGWPWTEELIAEAWVHPNVYIGTTAYAPEYWDEALVHFMQAHGKEKVLWGTNYPVVDHERSLEQLEEFGFDEGPLRKVLSENAKRVFDL
jgi:predicted TIM-barrel fold metal-dependent hydrolase